MLGFAPSSSSSSIPSSSSSSGQSLVRTLRRSRSFSSAPSASPGEDGHLPRRLMMVATLASRELCTSQDLSAKLRIVTGVGSA